MPAWKKLEFVMFSKHPAHTSVTSSKSATMLLLGTKICAATFTPGQQIRHAHVRIGHTEVDHLGNIPIIGRGYTTERINAHAMKAGIDSWICSNPKVAQQPVIRMHGVLSIDCKQVLLKLVRYLFRSSMHNLRSVASSSCLFNLLLLFLPSHGEAL